MEINLDTTNPAGRLIALPTTPPMSAGRQPARLRRSSARSSALTHARGEAISSIRGENFVWLVLALSAAALVLLSLSVGG